jgi:hypothetical protein
VNERSVVALSAIAGAALGGLAGFLFLTDRGRVLRREIEPRLDEFARDLANLQGSVARARSAASEGWRVVRHAAGERGSGWTNDQAAPF